MALSRRGRRRSAAGPPTVRSPPSPRIWDADTVPEHVRVAIIGAGFGGLGAGVRLRQAGMTGFVILERAASVGGTWRDNTYPGCACDIPSHLYSFSFAPNPGWAHSFSRQPEIWDYLEEITDRHGLRGHLRLGAEVTEARWDAGLARWRLRIARTEPTDSHAGPDPHTGPAAHTGLTADVLISAAGPLSEPRLPDIPGLAEFPGEVFHSARWDHGARLDGKRVAVVGTGASAIQIVPEIQPTAARLVLFQRTPAWVLPRRDRVITGPEKWVYRHFPPAQRLARLGNYLAREPAFAAFVARPGMLEAAQRIAERHLAKSVADPVLRAKLTPRYVMGCKRILLSSDFYPALTRPNVEVVDAGLARVDGHTAIAGDGTARDVDVIILATGFGAAGHHRTGLPQPVPGHRAQHRARPQLDDPHHRVPAPLHPGLPRDAGPDRGRRPRRAAGRAGALVRRHRAADGVLGLGHRRLREMVPQRRRAQHDALARLHARVPARHLSPGRLRVPRHHGVRQRARAQRFVMAALVPSTLVREIRNRLRHARLDMPDGLVNLRGKACGRK